MKRLLLLALLIPIDTYTITFTQKDLRTYNRQVTAANTKAELVQVLTNFYTTYGDPESYDLGDNFIKYARQQWTTVATGPFFSYAQFELAQQPTRSSSISVPPTPKAPTRPSSVSTPSQPTITPVRPQPTPKLLSPTQFVTQMTDQVIKSLNLLTSTLKDPLLNQEVTNDQYSQLKTALSDVTALLNQAGK